MQTTIKSVRTHFGSQPAETADSWKNPVRMLYRVTITVQSLEELGKTDILNIVVANFHNAEAIQEAYRGSPNVDVTIAPDVISYINKIHPHLNTDVPTHT